jgi:hypothetical protein
MPRPQESSPNFPELFQPTPKPDSQLSLDYQNFYHPKLSYKRGTPRKFPELLLDHSRLQEGRSQTEKPP